MKNRRFKTSDTSPIRRYKQTRLSAILLFASLGLISLTIAEFTLHQHSVGKIILFFLLPALWAYLIFEWVVKTNCHSPGNNPDHNQENNNRIRQLKRLEKFRREYIGNVSHELKTPVFNIQGYLESLLENAKNNEEWQNRFLKKALENTERLNHIIRDLEMISENENENLQLNINSFNMAELMHEVFDSFQILAQKQSVRLILNESSCHHTVYADRERIRQVLVNLIENAIKYNKINGEVKGNCRKTPKGLLVEIADTGIGIKKKHIPRIFERFYRIDKTRSRKKGGSGLGLSIVKHILEAHHAEISVTSTPGKGSIFSFKLPATSPKPLSKPGLIR